MMSIRKNRALYRAGHRGTKEMDLILESFAKSILPDLDEAGLERFEALLEISDPVLMAWIFDGGGDEAQLALQPELDQFIAFAKEGHAARR